MRTRMPRELRMLGAMFRARDPEPARAVLAAYQAGNRIRSVRETGAGDLTLIGDSAEAAPTGARARGKHRERTLTFAVPGKVIELDLAATHAGMFRASGMVICRSGQPVPEGTITLRHPNGEVGGELDAHGAFSAEDIPAGPLSVTFRAPRSHAVAAEWLVC